MDSTQAANSRLSGPSARRLIVLSLLVGIGGGALLLALTVFVSRSDIGGPGWTLGGNGALVVPFAGGPALMAAGWVALALYRKGVPHSRAATALAGASVLVLALLEVFAPVIGIGSQELVGAIAPLVALLLGVALVAWVGGSIRTAAVAGVAAWLLFLLSVFLLRPLFYILGPLLLAPIVAWPLLVVSLVEHGSGRMSRMGLLVASILLPIALFGGLVGAGNALSALFMGGP